MRVRFLTTLIAVSIATSALAQDEGSDWELVRQPENRTVFAFVPMTTGLTIAFRCVDGAYGAVIAGLPEARRTDRTRVLRIRVGDKEPDDTVWNVTTDRTVAIADYPGSWRVASEKVAPSASLFRGGPKMAVI